MARSFFNQRRLLAATTVALLVASFLKAQWVGPVAQVPRNAMLALLAPFSRALKEYVADPLRPATDPVVDLGSPEVERRNYLQQLQYDEKLRQDLAEARRQVEALQNLRRWHRFDTVSFLSAKVASWSADAVQHTLTLSRGTRDGLQVGQVVVDGASFNLVGRIVEAGPKTAAVRLITMPGTRLDVCFRSVSPQAPARDVIWQVQADGDGAFVAQIKADDPVKPGDLAHLIDVSNSGWPAEARGFFVGVVERIAPWDSDPTSYNKVVVRPIHALSHLSRVEVLVPAEAEQR